MHFGIFGAGSIGCYVGGMLAAAGEKVTMVGRPTMAAHLWAGIEVTQFDGLRHEIAAGDFTFAGEPAALGDCDVVLVCVKSGDTEEAGRQLAGVAAVGTTVVSLQNGVSNAARLREALPGRTVLAAMVPFNVARIGENRFHCGTRGVIEIEDTAPAREIVARLSAAGLPARASADIDAVLWGKLLINLNNAVNVLSGLPLKAQLSDRDYRRVFAASVAEALAAMRAAGIRPAPVGRVRPQIMPFVLRLPDWLFRLLAANMLKIDEAARSSMAEDLDSGRKPEIDFLNGEIVRLGRQTGVPTPVNAKLAELVEAAFADGRSPELSGRALAAQLGL